MKIAKCKVWEIDNPAVYWVDIFEVEDYHELEEIFRKFNSSLRPLEKPRNFEFIKYLHVRKL